MLLELQEKENSKPQLLGHKGLNPNQKITADEQISMQNKTARQLFFIKS
jgi:hypothetical protein